MASLYEIDQSILSCVDPETGEIIDVEQLQQLMMDKQAKIEGIALWVKNLESDAAAFAAEEAAFADRKKRAAAKADALKKYLTFALNGVKFATTRCAVSFRRSTSVHVDDVALLPEGLLRVKTTTEPDKTAIKAALKSGQDVAGCSLVENLSVSIK